MPELKLEPVRTALLIMDFQSSTVERYATDPDDLLSATAKTISAARRVGMLLIYVVVGFRPGFPEVSSRNPTFSAIKTAGGIPTDIHARVAPAANEVVVMKHRVSAFAGTDLDMILRSNEVDTLVLCGVATSGVVLSTLRQAADADYRIIVLRDCCGDLDAEVHACLMNKVFPRQATVLPSVDFTSALQDA
jgi:nicotinamidase-related amidase